MHFLLTPWFADLFSIYSLVIFCPLNMKSTEKCTYLTQTWRNNVSLLKSHTRCGCSPRLLLLLLLLCVFNSLPSSFEGVSFGFRLLFSPVFFSFPNIYIYFQRQKASGHNATSPPVLRAVYNTSGDTCVSTWKWRPAKCLMWFVALLWQPTCVTWPLHVSMIWCPHVEGYIQFKIYSFTTAYVFIFYLHQNKFLLTHVQLFSVSSRC